MFAALISLAFAILLMIYPEYKEASLNLEVLSIFFIAISLVILLIYYLILNFTLSPLQKAEKNVTSHLVQFFHKDLHIRIAHLYINLFPLLTLIIVFAGFLFPTISKVYFLAAWIILLGIALDTLSYTYKRALIYLDPYSVIKLFTHAARISVQDEKEEDLCDWIDALSESAIKAVQSSNISLSNDALHEIQLITHNFLQSSKSISHHDTDAQSKKMGIGDKVSFTLFYVFQRFEMINEKAIEHNLEPVSSSVITNLGKIAVHAAQYDISLAGYPIFILGKCAKRAQTTKFPEAANRAISTLLEVAKTIPQEIDVTYLELKDTYLTLLTQLHEIAKESFKQDKSIRISELTQPFKTLLSLFEEPKLAEHQDTPAIVDAIKQVQAEFDALELIMKTIPPLPDIPEESPPTPEKI